MQKTVLSIGQRLVLLPWAGVALFGSIYFSIWCARAICRLLVQYGVPSDIAKGIAFPFLMPGAIWLAIFLVSLPVFWWMRHDIRPPKTTSQFLAYLVMVFLPVILMSCCWWAMVTENQTSVISAITATIVSIIMGIGVVFVFLWLERPRKNSDSETTAM